MAEKLKEVFSEFGENDYYFDRDSKVLKINLMGSLYGPSLEDFPFVMSRVIDLLRGIKEVNTIVLIQDREYEYDREQTNLLREIAEVIENIRRKKLILPSNVAIQGCEIHIPRRLAFLQDLIVERLRSDPIGAYVRLNRYIEEQKVLMNREMGREKFCFEKYIHVLERIKKMLDETEMIRRVKNQLPGFHIGSRDIYRQIFHPTIRPNFMLTRYMSSIPEGGIEVDRYIIKEVNAEVRIFKVPNDVRLHYHVFAPEFELDEEEYNILDTARRYMAEHEPTESEFAEPEKTRQVFFNIGKDMIQDIASNLDVELTAEQVDKLANILTRYTAGFGVLEIILADDNLQDIYVNSPVGKTPIFALHGKYGEVITNLIPTREDAESWATRFRMMSGRPLDEANPVLDTELEVPGGRARVAIITRNLSPEGLAFAFRRHRDKPWTFPLFIKARYMNPLSAGLLSFIIDGARTMLIAGTRSSGKCVAKGTLIQLSNGSIVEIEKLFKGKDFRIEDGYIHESNNIEVQCLDENKIKSEILQYVWKRYSPKELVRIRTKTGREIITTKEHRYLIYDRGFTYRNAEKLKKGDFIATPLNLKISGREIEIDLRKNEYYIDENEQFYILKEKNSVIKFPKKINEELSELTGMVFGGFYGGNISFDNNKIEFCTENKEIVERFGNLLKTFNFPFKIFESEKGRIVEVNSTFLYKLLNEIFKIQYGIPQDILKSRNEVVSKFLKGLFSSISYVDNEKLEIKLSIPHEKIVMQLQMILLRFGIVSFLNKSKDNYELLIKGNFIEKFMEEIGFSDSEKTDELRNIRNNVDHEIDIIPEGSEILKEIFKYMNIPLKFNNNGKMGRSLFRKLLNLCCKRYGELISLKERNEGVRGFSESLSMIGNESSNLIQISSASNKGLCESSMDGKVRILIEEAKKLLESEIFWDEIEKVEFVKNKEKFVYDLSVNKCNNFVANGLIAHNTSLLSACMTELMKKYRICTVEDSVTGNCEIICRIDGKFRRIKVGNLIDKLIEENKEMSLNILGREILPVENLEVFSMDGSGKVKISKVRSVIRHKVNKKIYEIVTETGRRIEVTGDHSLFTLNDDGKIKLIRTNQLEKGDHIAVPKILNCGNKHLREINLIDHLENLNGYIYYEKLKSIMKKRYEEIRNIAMKEGFSEKEMELWMEKGILPVKILKNLRDLKLNSENSLYCHNIDSAKIPLRIELNKDFLVFMGICAAIEKSHEEFLISRNEDIEKILRRVCNKLKCGFEKERGFIRITLNSTLLEVMNEIFEIRKEVYARIPEFAFNLSEKQILWFLKGFLCVKGRLNNGKFEIKSKNEKLLKDIQTLLLFIGRISRLEKFDNYFILKIENFNHEEINISSTYNVECNNGMLLKGNVIFNEILFDRIKSIREINYKEIYVYDFSVPENENFVCENIVAHNTLELPVPALIDLGYNIERMKSRSVITQVESELSADDAIRTALRLGDSVLIIGEVRSSIRGDEEVFIVEDGITKRIPIKEIEGRDYEKIMVPSLDKDNKIKLLKLNKFVKHVNKEELIKVRTKTGREVTVTKDHSLFILDENNNIREIETEKLKIGDKILIPSSLPFNYNNIEFLNIKEMCNSDISMEKIPVNESFCRFLGYFISSGNISNNGKVIFKTDSEEIMKDLGGISEELFGIRPSIEECNGKRKIVLSIPFLSDLLRNICLDNKKEKRIPSIIYGLSRNKICSFLRGLYSSGEVNENSIKYSTFSKEIANDLLYLLLTLKIVANFHYKDNRFFVEFSEKKFVDRFINNVVKEIPEVSDSQDNEFYLDEIISMKKVENKDEFVYDLSVTPSENFIGGFGGIILHNTEARALYEAMRIGALANFVGGTIHGDSAYGVFDRVVNDLGVPPTSFKATDIVVIANTLKSPDGLHTYRRITNIVEVRKDWSKDPLREKAFVDLMVYDAEKDELVPTDTLLNGESYVLNAIANKVREWKNNWEAVWNNIVLRAKIKEKIVEYSEKLNKPEILEADFVVKANDMFHEISEKVKDELGFLDNNLIYQRWKDWLEKELGIKRMVYEREIE